MAGRDVTAGAVTALTAGTVRPVLIGRLDIATDPVVAWTGPGTFLPTGSGDAALDGQTFLPMAPFVELSSITENQGIGGPATLTVAGHDLDEDLLLQVVNDKRTWRGRKAWLWLGLLNVDEATVVVDPFRIKTGVMVDMRVVREPDNNTIQVSIDKDLGNARAAPLRWIDHVRFFTADTFSTFVIALANKPQGFNASDLRNQEPLPQRRPSGPRYYEN